MTNKKFDKLFGKPTRNAEKRRQFYMDIASSIQNVTEVLNDAKVAQT